MTGLGMDAGAKLTHMPEFPRPSPILRNALLRLTLSDIGMGQQSVGAWVSLASARTPICAAAHEGARAKPWA